mmetsp:Transcript_6001/g.19215  ORF Transcript_6001/g.19215 Transcript_6001/m.19215 type:complete len:92 (+) Transcript_6001:1025-1300(+)
MRIPNRPVNAVNAELETSQSLVFEFTLFMCCIWKYLTTPQVRAPGNATRHAFGSTLPVHVKARRQKDWVEAISPAGSPDTARSESLEPVQT